MIRIEHEHGSFAFLSGLFLGTRTQRLSVLTTEAHSLFIIGVATKRPEPFLQPGPLVLCFRASFQACHLGFELRYARFKLCECHGNFLHFRGIGIATREHLRTMLPICPGQCR